MFDRDTDQRAEMKNRWLGMERYRLQCVELQPDSPYKRATLAAMLFSRVTVADGVGNIGRNVLRSNGIKNVDFGLVKNTRISRISEAARLQFRAEFYNLTNTRNFGIPEGRVSSANFLNQWGTDGGNRRIVAAIRFVF